jgi:hypothetical protein
MTPRDILAKLAEVDESLSLARETFARAFVACRAGRSGADAQVLDAMAKLDKARAQLCDIADETIGGGEGCTQTGRPRGRPRRS